MLDSIIKLLERRIFSQILRFWCVKTTVVKLPFLELVVKAQKMAVSTLTEILKTVCF